MNKFNLKESELKEQSDYWNTVLSRPGFSHKKDSFRKLCFAHAEAVEKDLKHVKELNSFVKNNYRSK